jgi:hypothetical protein
MKTPSFTHEEIAGRAYQIHVANGRQPGHELDDWLQAEYELLQRPIRVLAETNVRPTSEVKLLVDVVRNTLLSFAYNCPFYFIC